MPFPRGRAGLDSFATRLLPGSALFHNSSATGGTQYGDATLRSSYWSYVKAHGTKSSSGTHTYAWASWMEPGVFGAKSADTAAISHETAEWLNDPFVNDIVPRWSVPSEPQYGCSNLFEVGDPLVGHTFTVGRWHFQDETNFSWFARQSPSIGFKGRYSYLGTFKTFSKSC